MRKSFFFLLFSLLIIAGYAQNFWTQRANFPGMARYRAMGIGIGDKGYLLMGAGNNVPSTSDLWEYNTVTNTWTQKADFPGTSRGGGAMAAFEIGGKAYCGLGAHWAGGPGNYTYYNDFYMYDPANNTWTQKADFPGPARHCLVSFSIEGKGYVISGADASSYMNDMWEYNPTTNAWTQKASVGTSGRAMGIGFSIGGKGYFGLGSTFSGTLLSDFWEYDQASNTWSQKADYPGSGKKYGNGYAVGNYGFVGFGMNSSTWFKDFWIYNPASNAWTQKSNLITGTGRHEAAGFVAGGKIYVATGYDGWYLDDLWEYTPDGYGINNNANINIQYQWLNSTSQLTVTAPDITSLAVYDINGRLLTTLAYAHQDEIQTDLSLPSSGVYIFQVITNGTAVAKKIVKN